ncbi:hypothetical protein KW787_04095 [Candidatus Pacearchaeota archaeon]|nr:hypothetical protein [Candidatus Pacearchaeota archaeon]
MSVIDMHIMRYINLLDRASNVKTRKCFIYNNIIYFAVPEQMMSKAIGPDASNIRALQDKLGKRIRIVKEAEGLGDAARFLEDVVAPVKFKSLEIKDGEIIITAGSTQNKAALIGRNRIRFDEMKKLLHEMFGMGLRIL